MAQSTRSTIVGVFAERAQAERAVEALRQAGFAHDAIGVVTRNEAVPETESSAIGTVVGGATGTVTGGLLAALLGSALVVAVPGIGPLLLAGVLATIVTGAAISGALVGMGVPKEAAHHYEQQVKAGRTLIVVKAGSRYEEAWALLDSQGAEGMAVQAIETTSVS